MSSNVYQLIAKVSAELAKAGIAKSRHNQQQGYQFRGIDDVYNVLAPVMSAAGLVILPRILSRSQTERTTPKGGVLFFVTVEAEFDFVSSHDGSRHTIRTFGEAMDSGDKATNKAMSAAYKYAALQTFCIPTEGDNDADAHSVNLSSKFDLAAALVEVDRAATLEALQEVWKKQGALAVAAQDRDGHKVLKDAVSEKKVALNGEKT